MSPFPVLKFLRQYGQSYLSSYLILNFNKPNQLNKSCGIRVNFFNFAIYRMGVVFSRKNKLKQRPSNFHISTNFSDEENLAALKNFALGSLKKHNKEKEVLLSPNTPKQTRSQSETKHRKFSPLRNSESIHLNQPFRNLHKVFEKFSVKQSSDS